MYYYFCADYSVAMKLNGLYFATLSNDIMPCNFEEEKLPFIEVCPLNACGKAFTFFPSSEFLQNPPAGVTVTDLMGGYLIKFYNENFSGEFGICAQERLNGAVSTVFYDGKYKLSIETPYDFCLETLDFPPHEVKFFAPEFYNLKTVIIAFHGKKNRLFAYSIEGKIRKIFEKDVDEYSLDNGFSTIEYIKDIAKHKITTVWDIKDNTLAVREKKIEKKEGFSIDNINEKVLPYAFLEELSCGGDISEYLGGNVLQNADKLAGFFGDYIGIMPPPLFRKAEEIGLVYSIKKNLYKVEYFTFSITDRKIINIKKCD